jgi:hypothetical protein
MRGIRSLDASGICVIALWALLETVTGGLFS